MIFLLVNHQCLWFLSCCIIINRIRIGLTYVSTIKPPFMGFVWHFLSSIGWSLTRTFILHASINTGKLACGIMFVQVSWGEGTQGSFLSPQAAHGLCPPMITQYLFSSRFYFMINASNFSMVKGTMYWHLLWSMLRTSLLP